MRSSSICRSKRQLGGVTIVDSDFHPLDAAARLADTVALSPRGDRTRRPPIEALPVGSELYLIRSGEDDLVIRDAGPADRALVDHGVESELGAGIE